MARFDDLTGKRFGELTVVNRIELPAKVSVSKWLCKCSCGKESGHWRPSLIQGRARSCGHLQKEMARSRFGSKSARWKGGIKVRKDGYVEMNIGDGSGAALMHRAVMEQKLSRKLLLGETVHHKNGFRADNRIENLEVWVTKQPKGQRIPDLVEYAKEILKRYEPAALVAQVEK